MNVEHSSGMPVHTHWAIQQLTESECCPNIYYVDAVEWIDDDNLKVTFYWFDNEAERFIRGSFIYRWAGLLISEFTYDEIPDYAVQISVPVCSHTLPPPTPVPVYPND